MTDYVKCPACDQMCPLVEGVVGLHTTVTDLRRCEGSERPVQAEPVEKPAAKAPTKRAPRKKSS